MLNHLPGTASGTRSPIAALRRYAQAGSPLAREEERCELCSRPLAAQHRHLLAMPARRIVCSCDPCALSFQNVAEGRFRLIPRDPTSLPDFRMEDAEWENLALPIDLAFVVRCTPGNRVTAFYPSPAGATESLLRLAAWETLVADNPVLATMQPDVEALLVKRVGPTPQYFLAPIDACFELVGLVRLHWRGLSGGARVWDEIEHYFDALGARSRSRPQFPSHA
jgi:hypothetical protein